MYPYKGVSLTQLFQNMAADEDTEETLVADSTSDPNSDWGTQDEQDCALFAESQRLIGSTLHDADAIEVQRSNETKHKSHILVPELNSMVHKAKVIKQLAQNKKVSAGRLIRIQHAQEPQESESDDGVDVDGRSNIGLWNDVAFESEVRCDDERPYRLAQVLRMCRLTSTRRRTEYVKPVNLQRDSVKNIQLLVKP